MFPARVHIDTWDSSHKSALLTSCWLSVTWWERHTPRQVLRLINLQVSPISVKPSWREQEKDIPILLKKMPHSEWNILDNEGNLTRSICILARFGLSGARWCFWAEGEEMAGQHKWFPDRQLQGNIHLPAVSGCVMWDREKKQHNIWTEAPNQQCANGQ